MYSEAQLHWPKFIADVRIVLGLEKIDSILDRTDKSPVCRISTLRNNGEYLVRQDESSAILEVLNTRITPVENSWEITANITDIQRDLNFDLQTFPAQEVRVHDLVSLLKQKYPIYPISPIHPVYPISPISPINSIYPIYPIYPLYTLYR